MGVQLHGFFIYLNQKGISMSIGPNQIVTTHFTIKDAKGSVVDSTSGQEPYSFLSYSHQMLPKIEEILDGMEVGTRTTTVLAPADGYGEYRKDKVVVTPRSGFPKGVELKEGMTFLTMRGGYETPAIIKHIDGDDVTVDFNHPLAGETVTFEVELLGVRDAIPEELADEGCHEHGCGCGH